MAAAGTSSSSGFVELAFRWQGPTKWEGPVMRKDAFGKDERSYCYISSIQVGKDEIDVPDVVWAGDLFLKSGSSNLVDKMIESVQKLKPHVIFYKLDATEPACYLDRRGFINSRESAMAGSQIDIKLPEEGLKEDERYCLVFRSSVVPSKENSAFQELSVTAELVKE